MITGGFVTVFVSDMDRAVHFYTKTLGLELTQRFGNHWASVQAPNGLVIGLHPASEQSPAGKRGSISIGFQTDEPIAGVVDTLTKQGVTFPAGIIDDTQVLIAPFADPDGNELYFAEARSDLRPGKSKVSAA